jgi:hypothetical protein
MSISVLIPCFDAEPFLAQAIESALAQSRPADEIVVVDDGSRDRSREIAARYPVRSVALPENRGPAAARNVAIREARGDLLVWLDADDWFEPRHVEVVAGLLDRHPDAAVAWSAVRLRGDANGVFGGRSRAVDGPCEMFWECLVDTVVPPMSAAVRRAALERVGGYDERFRFSEDFDLWLRLSRRERFVASAEVTSNYRRHPLQASAHPRDQRRAVYLSRRLLLEQLRREGESDLASRVVARMERIWEAQLAAAWAARDADELTFLLGLAGELPAARAGRRYRWLLRLPPPIVAAWDALRARRAASRSTAGAAVS